MRVHHLDCATMCPRGGHRLGVDRMVGHCLLVEAPAGLVLVDTGFGTRDAARIPTGFRVFARPDLGPGRTAIAQVRALGFDPRDVRDLVLTHLDLDHAGGLADFPHARVHVQATELARARHPSGLRDRLRYVAAQWDHGPRWVEHPAARGEAWRGFLAVRELPGLPPELLLVPLAGHSVGHQAVAVDTGDGWLLHAGDAYFHRGSLEEPPRPPSALVGFERFVAEDVHRFVANQRRLRTLARDHRDVRVFSAHDPDEFESLAHRSPT